MRHHRLLINRDEEITDWLVTSRFTWTSNVTKHVREKKKGKFLEVFTVFKRVTYIRQEH